MIKLNFGFSNVIDIKDINLIQRRFMSDRGRREESENLNEDDRIPIINGHNRVYSENLGERSITRALTLRADILNRPNPDINAEDSGLTLSEHSIQHYYNSNLALIGLSNERELREFQNNFARRLIERGHSDLVERITGLRPSFFDSDSENASERELEDNNSDNDNNDSDNDNNNLPNGHNNSDNNNNNNNLPNGHNNSDNDNNNSGNDNNNSDNDNNNSDNGNNDSDNDNNTSGGENLPLNGNSSRVENSNFEENLSENTNSNANSSASDFFSFVVFQFLNVFSVILDIITQMFFS